MNKFKSSFMVFLAFSVFVGVCQAVAEEAAFDIAQVATIYPDDYSTTRLLAGPQLPFPDSAIIIDRAYLNLIVEPTAADTTFISVRLYPVTVDWNADNVTWDSPWTNPGGDFNDVNYSEYAITLPGQQEIQIDLTDLCMRWADGRLPYFGFIIEVADFSQAPLQFVFDYEHNGGFGRIVISYTTMQPE